MHDVVVHLLLIGVHLSLNKQVVDLVQRLINVGDRLQVLSTDPLDPEELAILVLLDQLLKKASVDHLLPDVLVGAYEKIANRPVGVRQHLVVQQSETLI